MHRNNSKHSPIYLESMSEPNFSGRFCLACTIILFFLAPFFSDLLSFDDNNHPNQTRRSDPTQHTAMESEIVPPCDQLLQASVGQFISSFPELTRVLVAIGDCFTTNLASSRRPAPAQGQPHSEYFASGNSRQDFGWCAWLVSRPLPYRNSRFWD